MEKIFKALFIATSVTLIFGKDEVWWIGLFAGVVISEMYILPWIRGLGASATTLFSFSVNVRYIGGRWRVITKRDGKYEGTYYFSDFSDVIDFIETDGKIR